MAFVKPIKIITKKTGKIQSVLSQNFKFYTSYPLRVYLKAFLLYQIIVFYANSFFVSLKNRKKIILKNFNKWGKLNNKKKNIINKYQ
mgnify:CR=1 FL=1